MNTDYVPLSYRNLLIWLVKQETEVTAPLATTIGMSAGDRTAFLAAVAGVKAKADPIVAAMDTLEALTAGFPAILEQYAWGPGRVRGLPDEAWFIARLGPPTARSTDDEELMLEWTRGTLFIGVDFSLSGRLNDLFVDYR